MEKISFKSNPMQLFRLAMNQKMDKIENRGSKAERLARFHYMRNVSDEELAALVYRFTKEKEVENLTMKNWDEDSETILTYIEESELYKEAVIQKQRAGYGETGLGVYDKETNTFYDCQFAHHWDTIRRIIRSESETMHQAITRFSLYGKELEEYEGIQRDALDEMIINRFELIGGQKPVKEYL